MILITGSCGFIGYHLTEFYLNKGFKVIGVDNLNNYYDVIFKKKRLTLLKKKKNFKFIKIDLKKKKSYKKLNNYKNKIKFIFHLAGQAGVRYSLKNPASYAKNNIEAFLYLLENFKKSKKLKSIFYASSSSVYGQKKINSKENMISVYAVSKKTLEHLSDVYNHLYGMNFVGMRFFTVYGPHGRPDMSVYKFFKRAYQNKSIEIYNYGNHQRSFTYIDDLIYNIDRALNFYKNKKTYSKIHNIGNPRSIKLNYLVRLIQTITKRKIKKKYLPLQTGDVVKTISNIDKEKTLLGFKFQTNIEKGLKKFNSWYLNYHNLL